MDNSTIAPVSENPYIDSVTGFTKLFASLVHSTVWREEMHVKVVWITMLAMADRNGFVAASFPGLADASRVSLDQCRDALDRLSAPDVHSRTKAHEGRRIYEVEGGWFPYNYKKHRDLRNADERRIQTREYVRKHRQKKAKTLTVSNVSQSKPEKAQAEAEAEGEAKTTTSPAGGWVAEAMTIWQATQGEAKPGELGSALKPLVYRRGVPEVLRRFRIFAESKDARYGFHWFAKHFEHFGEPALGDSFGDRLAAMEKVEREKSRG